MRMYTVPSGLGVVAQQSLETVIWAKNPDPCERKRTYADANSW